MTQRNYTDKSKNEWTWEEAPETIQALKELHETVKRVNNNKFAGNYEGPLYAPHPDLQKEPPGDPSF
jgi:hypothetical protein